MMTNGAEATRPLTARDLALLDRVGDPQLSPDGRWLAYAVSATDWEGNGRVGALWMLDRQAPDLPARRLEVSDKPASHPRWSPDGRALYFLSPRSGSPQIWRTDAAGARAAQVTDLPVGVGGFRLGPDGRTLVLALTLGPGCATLAETRAWQAGRKAGPVTAIAVERLPMAVWDGWRAGERTQLFALALDGDGKAAGEPTPLMRGFDAEAPERPHGSDADYAVGEREVVFSALEPGQTWGGGGLYRLYAAPLDGSAPPRRLDPGDAGSCRKPTLSPDGRRLAFLSARAAGPEVRAAVMVRDLATGETIEADPGFDRSADALAWAPDGRTLYAVMADLGRTRLFAIDTAARSVAALTEAGAVSGVSARAGGLVVARAGLDGPAQLYDLAQDAARPLTRANAGKLAGVALSPHQPFSFAGWNGETVHGHVVQPHGCAPGRRYPVAFLIHGGPYASFGDDWSYRWNPQVFAGMGFAVVTIDFHGSAGYGEAFGRSIVNHWGDRPLEDLQKGWAAALAQFPYLDPDRACALGGSYGGYMTAWMAGVWDEPWKCFVTHATIFDVRSWALTGDVPGFADHEFGGPPWAAGEAYERFNPLGQAHRWRKPMLVIHGGKDHRVPPGQGMAAFTAAQRRNVPSRLLYYPDEGHWVQKPQNAVAWYGHVEDWMRRWIGPDPAG